MRRLNVKQLKRLGVVLLGAYVVSGCPSPSNSSLLTNQETTQSPAIAQNVVESSQVVEETAIRSSAAPVTDVTFEVCADVDSWQRPSHDEQSKQLGSDPRYGQVGSSSALKSASSQFWDHQIISFTTYGLSARMEPVNLSGLWSVADDLWGCYEPETTLAINEGDRAEAWLLNQRIRDLQWQGDRYVMTVEPAASGMQVVQFDRLDEQASLPLEVVTASGDRLEVASGDWQ